MLLPARTRLPILLFLLLCHLGIGNIRRDIQPLDSFPGAAHHGTMEVNLAPNSNGER
jgi:hypothetical protein